MKALIGIIVSLCGGMALAQESQGHKHHTMPALSVAKISGDSVFNFEGKFTDQNNKSVVFKDFANKKVLITMAYTSCQFSCPIIVGKLKEIEKKLASENVKDVQIVLISFDLKRDTVDKFKDYIKTKSITGTNWHFLRAETPEDVQEISAILGVSYKAEPDGEFSHSNVISLLDAKGVIKYQLIGMNSDTTELFKQLKEKK